MELLSEKLIYYICYLAFLILPFGIILILHPFSSLSSNGAVLRRRILGILAVLFSLGLIWVRFIEPKILLVHNFDISSKEEKIKIAVASDFHYGVFKNAVSLKRIVKKINEGNPDLVLLPGDFVYQAQKKDIEGMFSELKNLKAPVCAVLGNHDVGLQGEIDDKTELKAELGKYALVLENEQVLFESKGRKITILGLSDLLEGKIDFNLLQDLNPEDFVLVLEHNPDSVYFFPKNVNVDLMVSGHTHAGQIRVPILYKRYLPSQFGLEKGIYEIQGIKTFITSGIGVSVLPFRFLIPPEIAFLEI